MVDVLLEHVLVCEVHMAINVLQPGRLAKADELVVDEAILDMVELSCPRPIMYHVGTIKKSFGISMRGEASGVSNVFLRIARKSILFEQKM